MPRPDDTEYFKRRAEEEDAAAIAASDPTVAETHRLMAAEYNKLVAKTGPNNPSQYPKAVCWS